MTAGWHHTCVLSAGGAVRCWGVGEFGRLGYASTEDIGNDETPASVGAVQVGAPVVQVVAGGERTCALLETGSVRCWGHASFGTSLGYGNMEDIGDDETPAAAGDVPIGGNAIELAADSFHTCAILDTGSVR